MANQPCPCGKSSDAYEPYSNGGFCFSCSKKFRGGNIIESQSSENKSSNRSFQVLPYRGHSVESLRRYGVVLEVEDDTPTKVRYPYPSGWNKYRILSNKTFYSEGTVEAGLFGMDKFGAGSAKSITITEGEEDALAVYELLGSKWPAVSIRGSSSAKVDCTAAYQYLNSFEQIYLCFDEDEAGQRAVEAVSSLFPFNKIFIVHKTLFKDANDYLIKGAHDEYRRVWYNAKRNVPTNIISSFDEVASILDKPEKTRIATFPFEGLQKATLGIRTGETYLFKASEGIGKTEFFGAIEHHVLKTTDVNIAIIHLEDPEKRMIQRIANYELQMPVHLKDVYDIPNADVLEAYRKATKRDHRLHIYTSLENEDYDAVLNRLRFMVASCECKLVFLDHISRLVSGNLTDDERRTLDAISTRLSQLAQELDFALIMVSHVNDDGLTRGSRNISKEAWTVVSLKRSITALDSVARNTTYLTVEKNRFAGITGPAGCVYFDPDTFTLSDTQPSLKELPSD